MRMLPAIDPDLAKHFNRNGEKFIYEGANAFVLQRGEGHFVVFRNTSTHSERCGTFHLPSRADEALERAIQLCDSIQHFTQRPYGR